MSVIRCDPLSEIRSGFKHCDLRVIFCETKTFAAEAQRRETRSYKSAHQNNTGTEFGAVLQTSYMESTRVCARNHLDAL